MGSIKQLLQMKGDQGALIPDGNWIAVEGGGSYKGYEYLIVLNMLGNRCGYVAIPDSHPYSKVPMELKEMPASNLKYESWDCDSLEIECHGGLTFMSPKHGLKELLPIACNDMWIGFDCGHLWDKPDLEATRKYFGEEYVKKHQSFFDLIGFYPTAQIRDYSYVESECKSIVDQLIRANNENK